MKDDTVANALIRRTLLAFLLLANGLVWLSLILQALAFLSRSRM